MAILCLSYQTTNDAQMMRAFKKYFDEFIEVERKKYFIRFFVYKDGLPEDDTEVLCCTSDDDGLISVSNVLIQNRKA